MDPISFVNSLSIPTLGLNWIDIVILIIIIFYTIEGYSSGFLSAFIDLVAFSVSFLLGISFYLGVSNLIVKFFSIPKGFANAIGFFLVAVLFEIFFNFVLKSLIYQVPFFKSEDGEDIFKKINKFLGVIPGFLSGIILSSFILSLIIALPFSIFLKHSVASSKMGSVLVANTQVFAKQWNSVFGGAVNDTLSFLTVEPKGNESVALNFKTSNVSKDLVSEKAMFEDVNKERASRGIAALTTSDLLLKIARDHCKDMFVRGYFSHYTLEGLSPFDRMVTADISFNYAGENLALAPSVDLAMKGLMQSPGHKANILSSNFQQVGIGVIDGGVYGEMFCQEFTD